MSAFLVCVGCVQDDMGGEVAFTDFQASSDWLDSHSVKSQRLTLKDLVNKGKLLRFCSLIGIMIVVMVTNSLGEQSLYEERLHYKTASMDWDLDWVSCAKAHIDNRKKLVKQQCLPTCSYNMVSFGLLAAELGSLVWVIPANFNRFHVLAALLHGTLVVDVSQTLWL